ncbi:hypothetical protein [Crateriforma conspicua]|uniref:Uncharacterized protein n=2 Tax=Crateriforma conspicua TaxID=2527996 RepID=A0A5C6FP25_9PLAN|nr:hypothetical protein V7x_41630 [Crateriforma conspicua]
MSTLPTNEPPRKQPPNVYTVMLILSTVFMLIAVVAMLIEAGRWAPDYWNTRTAQPSVMHIEADAGSLFRG